MGLHRSHLDVIDDIRGEVQALNSLSTISNLFWIAGYVDSKGNELSDKAAQEAATEALSGLKSPTKLPTRS